MTGAMTATSPPTTATAPTTTETDGEDAGNRPDFPPGFAWGAATAAFQIEGAAAQDGRTPSIWDTFCRVPGAVIGGDNGDVACDHFHRWPQDLDLMARLGLNAYRFSTSWSRIVPESGRIEPRGLDFYSRLVDGLLERGIQPWLTLYHWDLPQWLEDLGGWANRDIADRMTEYALALNDRLGDRVRHWSTLNEPWCAAYLGYAGGQHAPGRQEPQAAVSAMHHLLLAHGRTARALRAVDRHVTLGLTVNCTVSDPAHPWHPEDAPLARRNEMLLQGVFVEPALRGRYPDGAAEAYATAGATIPVRDGDLAEIAAPIDFLGVNYYNGGAVCAHSVPTDEALPTQAPVTRPTSPASVGLGRSTLVSRRLPRTAMDWEVQPDGLRRLLESLHRDYTGPAGIPLYVTENGAAFDDVVSPDGSVDDPERTAYVLAHLGAVADAVQAGADVRGYFVWSLLDNFEWAYGYAKRFGVVHVDFATQRRTPKRSALAYADVIRTGRLDRAGTVGS
jgi:beta-glucosidase